MRKKIEPKIRLEMEFDDLLTAIKGAEENDLIVYHIGYLDTNSGPSREVLQAAARCASQGLGSLVQAPDRSSRAEGKRIWSYMLQVTSKGASL